MKDNNKKKLNRKLTFDDLILDLIIAGLKKDVDEVELNAITLARKAKDTDPELAKKIAEMIGNYTVGGKTTRSRDISPVPTDNETQLEMASIILPNIELNPPPVLSYSIQETVNTFLKEREKVQELLSQNIRPTTSLLLIGPPGTGKTMLAKYIASALNKNLVVLDLAASISSLLGKTGYNLKRVLRYARQTSSVLLLDEFDAIAKRRDDTSDLGELKRVVNVLLMELETWPISSVLIATSNHPTLLDHAIWRRFDHTLRLELPEEKERYIILSKKFAEYFKTNNNLNILKPIAEMLENYSAADLTRFSENIMRRSILSNIDPIKACMQELPKLTQDKEAKGKYCRLSKELFGDEITVRELAEITGLSPSGVQYHIKKM